MTAAEAIQWIDDKKHNVYSREDKLAWLKTVEAMAEELYGRSGLASADGDTLSIPAPYDQLYLRWLEAQIDYNNQEYLKYNNAMDLFAALWREYANKVRRSSAPVGKRVFF